MQWRQGSKTVYLDDYLPDNTVAKLLVAKYLELVFGCAKQFSGAIFT
jgi:hypothetical protein